MFRTIARSLSPEARIALAAELLHEGGVSIASKFPDPAIAEPVSRASAAAAEARRAIEQRSPPRPR